MSQQYENLEELRSATKAQMHCFSTGTSLLLCKTRVSFSLKIFCNEFEVLSVLAESVMELVGRAFCVLRVSGNLAMSYWFSDTNLSVSVLRRRELLWKTLSADGTFIIESGTCLSLKWSKMFLLQSSRARSHTRQRSLIFGGEPRGNCQKHPIKGLKEGPKGLFAR